MPTGQVLVSSVASDNDFHLHITHYAVFGLARLKLPLIAALVGACNQDWQPGPEKGPGLNRSGALDQRFGRQGQDQI